MPRWVTLRGVVAGVVIGALVAGGVAAASVSFDDVPSGKFYEAPAEWAKANGITTGSPAGSRTFKPEDPVTRGESVTFLKRYDDKVVQPGLADRYTKAEVDALIAGAGGGGLGSGTVHTAAVAADGTLVNGSTGVGVGPHTPDSGKYRVTFPVDVSNCNWQVTIGQRITGALADDPAAWPDRAEVSVMTGMDWTPVPSTVPLHYGTPDPTALDIGTRDSGGAPADHAFFVLVVCP